MDVLAEVVRQGKRDTCLQSRQSFRWPRMAGLSIGCCRMPYLIHSTLTPKANSTAYAVPKSPQSHLPAIASLMDTMTQVTKSHRPTGGVPWKHSKCGSSPLEHLHLYQCNIPSKRQLQTCLRETIVRIALYFTLVVNSEEIDMSLFHHCFYAIQHGTICHNVTSST